MGLFKKIMYILVAVILLILVITILFFGMISYTTDYLNKQLNDSLDCPQINKQLELYNQGKVSTKAGFITIISKDVEGWELGYLDESSIKTMSDSLIINCIQVTGEEAEKKKWNAVAGVWKHYFCDSADGDKSGVMEKTVELRMPNLFIKMQKISGKQEKQTVTFMIKQTIVNEYDENKNFIKTYCKRVEPQKTAKKNNNI